MNMGLLRELFGPSKKEIWKMLSDEIGSEFVEGGFFKADKVLVKHKDWIITLDTYTVSNGKSSTTYTRMRAPYVNVDGFKFSIYRSGIFTELGEFLGFHDIEIGDDDFDKSFVIKSSSENKVRELLSEPLLKELINGQSRFHLEIKDDEGWFGVSFPDGVDELCFVVPGVIKDIEQLKGLYEIFAQTLDRLCTIGAAYMDAPGVEL
jgi:hypothetical protein